jgi:hypothetical protein
MVEHGHAGGIRKHGRGILGARGVAGTGQSHIGSADFVQKESASARGRGSTKNGKRNRGNGD